MNERIIRLPQVKDLVGLGKTVIYSKIKAGDFPKPIKLGRRLSGWLESEVQYWIQLQIIANREPVDDSIRRQAPKAVSGPPLGSR